MRSRANITDTYFTALFYWIYAEVWLESSSPTCWMESLNSFQILIYFFLNIFQAWPCHASINQGLRGFLQGKEFETKVNGWWLENYFPWTESYSNESARKLAPTPTSRFTGTGRTCQREVTNEIQFPKFNFTQNNLQNCRTSEDL